MNVTILLGLLVVIQVVSSVEKYGSLGEEWAKYKIKFKKSYPNAEEEAKRKAIFEKNLETIIEHNKRYEAGEETYSKGLNQFSDLESNEIPMGFSLHRKH